MFILRFRCLALSLAILLPRSSSAQDDPLRKEALAALKKATAYYHSRVASHGGYVYYYSLDLSERWGEGKASPDILFVQPPGTPTVGMAFLKAHEATMDPFFLDAAKDAATALVHGQLQSGGWTQTIHFAPAKRMGKYRNGLGGSWNVSSLDDGQTQAALEFLIRVDRALEFKDEKIHEAALYGLNALRKAQFPNGAFPQVWIGPVEAKPIVKARYPDYDWRTEGKVMDYWNYYTLNDNLAGEVLETLLTAEEVYRDRTVRQAIEKLGDFLLLAQMPDPQPGWCQQYSYEMVPIWARKFEPPAVTAWESQDVMHTLIKIARHTGNKKYLEPIPKALDYFRNRCVLPDGNVARYYELKTNKPLYMDSKYQLTHDDSDAPRHYGWKQPARFDEISKALVAARAGTPIVGPRPAKELEGKVKRILASLDEQGRWVSVYKGERLVGQPRFPEGFRYLDSAVFSRNAETLSAYIAATAR